MAIIKIEGKEITLPDDVVKAGDNAIRAVLAANGFPAVENAHIEVVGAEQTGGPAIVNVSPRPTGKGYSTRGHGDTEMGGADSIAASPRRPLAASDFIERLATAPEYVNPAILLAAEAMRAETIGNTEFFYQAVRSGAVERAIAEGSREGLGVHKAMQLLGHVVPASSVDVPVGF